VEIWSPNLLWAQSGDTFLRPTCVARGRGPPLHADMPKRLTQQCPCVSWRQDRTTYKKKGIDNLLVIYYLAHAWHVLGILWAKSVT
jgi:hypothetical protein